jgi:hypothetical protein
MSQRAFMRTLAPILLVLSSAGCPSRPDSASSGSDGGVDPARGRDAVSPSETPPMSTPAQPDAAVAGDATVAAPDFAVDVDSESPSDANAVPEQPKLSPPSGASPIGTACQSASDCAESACVDGVCCASASCGTCQSCAVVGSAGVCAPLPELTADPAHQCTGSRTCDGSGVCAQITGTSCTSTNECLSGFCVDGVCCESARDEQCFSCNTIMRKLTACLPAVALGHACSTIIPQPGKCLPLTAGTDVTAAVACDGNRSCSLPPGETTPECLLNAGASCSSDGDCSTGHCSTYYRDADGDKYGDPSQVIQQCDTGNAAPAGYVAATGDCCDSDPAAHPNVTVFATHADACNSFDYNCDGTDEKKDAITQCWVVGSNPISYAVVACGAACWVPGSGSPAFTQGCR